MNDYPKPAQSCQVGQILDVVVQFLNKDGSPKELDQATDMKIRFERSNGTSVEHTAALLSDGLDGKIVYRTAADDLSIRGLYRIQGLATIDGDVLPTARGEFWVEDNIEIAPPEES